MLLITFHSGLKNFISYYVTRILRSDWLEQISANGWNSGQVYPDRIFPPPTSRVRMRVRGKYGLVHETTRSRGVVINNRILSRENFFRETSKTANPRKFWHYTVHAPRLEL